MAAFSMVGGFDRYDRGQQPLERMEPQPVPDPKHERAMARKERRKKRRDANVDAWAKETMTMRDYIRFRQEVERGCYTHAYDAWWWQRIRFSLWMASHSTDRSASCS